MQWGQGGNRHAPIFRTFNFNFGRGDGLNYRMRRAPVSKRSLCRIRLTAATTDTNDPYYRQWLAERRYNYVEYNRLNRERQREYWEWRRANEARFRNDPRFRDNHAS